MPGIPGAQIVVPQKKGKQKLNNNNNSNSISNQQQQIVSDSSAKKEIQTDSLQQPTKSNPNTKISLSTAESANDDQRGASAVSQQKQQEIKVLPRSQHPLATGITRVQIRDDLLELDQRLIRQQPQNQEQEHQHQPIFLNNLPLVLLPREFLSTPHVISTGLDRPNPLLKAGIPRGLVNGAGNACFVASVLQMLLQVPSFCAACVSASAAYVRRCVGESDNGVPRKRRGGDADEPTASVLGRWMLTYWMHTPAPLALPTLRVEDGPLKAPGAPGYARQSRMTGAIQQDAHEFLQLLLDRIDKDCCGGDENGIGIQFRSDLIEREAEEKMRNNNNNNHHKRGGNQNNNNKNGWVSVGNSNPKNATSSPSSTKNKTTKKNNGNDDDDGGINTTINPNSPFSMSSPSRVIFGGETQIQVKNYDKNDNLIPDKETGQDASKVNEPFLMMMAHVSSGRTISDLISASLGRDVIENIVTVSPSSNNNNNEKKNSQPNEKIPVKMLKTSKITSAPEYALLVHITRWAMTREGEVIKLDNVVKLDTKISLKVLNSSTKVVYRLKTVLCHRGRVPTSGHYVTYVYNYGDENDGDEDDEAVPSEIFCCNDMKVAPVKDSSVVEQDSPYLLCYLREV